MLRVVEECLEFTRTGWVAEFAKCLRFYLSDAFAGNGKMLTDFFECVF